MNKSDGIGEQLRAEILAIQGMPQAGWTVEQNLRTGAIVVTYFSLVTDLTVSQRTAAQAAITAHIASISAIGNDAPELLVQKAGYMWRHWSELSNAQKDAVAKAQLVLVMRAWGRWE